MKSKKKRMAMSEEELDRLHIMKQLHSKLIKQADASDSLGLSIRQIKRLYRNYKRTGAEGLISNHRGGNRAISEDIKQHIITTVKDKYHDFGPYFASEKLLENNGLKINRETLRQWMIEENLWSGKKRRKARIHQSRERRHRYGELIQIDGSHHDWFEGRSPKCCLLVFIDDATSKLMEMRFEKSETTMGYFHCVDSYIRKHGLPVALYSDKDSVFTVNTPTKIDGVSTESQFGRAMRELKIETILAYSPQAKGRVERANGTLQDRLVKEMRLGNISDIDTANEYLPEFIKLYNEKFSVEAQNSSDAHREFTDDKFSKLSEALSIKSQRTLSKNLEFSFKNQIFQIKRLCSGYSFRNSKVDIFETLDGRILVKRGNEYLNYSLIGKNLYSTKIADSKEINHVMDEILVEAAA
jgi:transposase